MITVSEFKREISFCIYQPQFRIAVSILFLLSVFSVWSGYTEISSQRSTIERLIEKDEKDRNHVLSNQKDYGGAAYYSFHLTWSEPSSLAFAAIGERDVFPWKHRIRMLALEGQIYETDADNPELSYLGRFDFAFLISVLLPLFMILMLHDMRASEREAGRFDLLIVTTRSENGLWLNRLLAIVLPMFLVVAIPFVLAAIVAQASAAGTVVMLAIVAAQMLFWSLLILGLGNLPSLSRLGSAQFASVLLSIWLVFAVIIPASSHALLKQLVHSPDGGDIMLTQREAVNDAWDLPFSDTWNAFLATHPEWQNYTQMESMFEWKWYYAFQQVGDQKAAELSQAYQQATVRKHNIAGYVALFSPTLMTQRLMTHVAQTDTEALLAYENKVRNFHGQLRDFYYPLLFENPEFSQEKLEALPRYQPNKNPN